MRALLRDARHAVQKKNQAINPGFEKSGGGTNVQRFRNLMVNPSVEAGGYFGAFFPNYAYTASTPSPGRTGTRCARYTNSGADTGASAMWAQGHVPGSGTVVAGLMYTGSMYVKPSVTRNLYAYIYWYNSAGAEISHTASPPMFVCSSSAWTRISITEKAPTGAVTAYVLFWTQSGVLSGQYFDLDSAMLTATPFLVPYFDGSYIDPSYGIEATSAWLGTTHLSESTLLTPPVDRTVYENLALDPQPNALPGGSGPLTVGWDSSRWFGPSGGAGTYSLVTGASDGPLTGITRYVRKTWTTAPSSNGDTGFNHTTFSTGGTHTNGLPVTAAATYTFSSYLRASATKTNAAAITVVWRDVAGNVIGSPVSGSYVTLTAGVWTRLVLTAAAPAGAVKAQIVSDVDLGTAWAVGQTLDGCALMITATQIAVPYFDGSFGNQFDIDMMCSWSGTANASTSLARGKAPAEVATTANVIPIQSIQWGKSGQSVRVIPVTSSTTTYASIGGVSGGLRLGLKPGKTYTIKATLRLPAPLSGGLHSASRRIVAFTKAGAAATIQYDSAQPPNTAGEHQVTLVLTIPSDADEAYVRLYNGASQGGGDAWWDDFMVVEGRYTGPYIDGTKAKAKWLGAAHASESVGYPASA